MRKFITLIAIASSMSILASRVSAQPKLTPAEIPPPATKTPPPTPTPSIPSPAPSPSTKPADPPPSNTKPDLSLLSKALKTFWQTNKFQSESEMILDGKIAGTEFKIGIRTKTIAQLGNKFRAEIILDSGDTVAPEKYQVISDGKKVWIYQPDRKKYARTTWTKFSEKQNFIFGFAALIFNQLSEAERQKAISNELPQALSMMMNSNESKDFTGYPMEVDGKQLYAYSYDGTNIPSMGIKMIALVEPSSGNLKEMRVFGRNNGVDFLITEKIFSRTNQVKIPANTFIFSPPRGTKRIKNLPIGTF
jgi:outer membrane lipoprotein-sorting protein